MSEVGPSCLASQSLFSQNCIPHNYEQTTLDTVLENAVNGVCAEHLTNMFIGCSPTHSVARWQGTCMASYEDFQSCLPGAFAYLSNDPKRCKWGSYFIFILNESMALSDSSYIKAAWLTAIQAARVAETTFCLPACDDSSDTFTIRGPKEAEIENARYLRGGTNYLARSLDLSSYIPGSGAASTVWNWFSKAEQTNLKTIYTAATHPLIWDIAPGIHQQGMRNQDIVDVYRKCAPFTYYTRYPLRYISLSALPMVLFNIVKKYLVLPLVNIGKQGVSNVAGLINNGFNTLWEELKRQGKNAMVAFYEKFLAKNQLFEIISSIVINSHYFVTEVLPHLWNEFWGFVGKVQTYIKDKWSQYSFNPYHMEPEGKKSYSYTYLMGIAYNISQSTDKMRKKLFASSEEGVNTQQVDEINENSKFNSEGWTSWLFGSETESSYSLS